MISVINGAQSSGIAGARWVKVRARDALNECVELARVNENEVAVRNSRFPDGPALVFTQAEFVAFLDGAVKGEFDSMTV